MVTRAAVAAGLLVVVLALAAGGLRASAGAQLVLVSVLIGTIVAAVAGSATSARFANWTPFAPHGWLSVGHAATTLMLSFVGWEAVAPLTTRFADPSRQLPRVIGIALAATTGLYLSLAIATVGVLGPDAGSSVPLADLLRRSIGAAGPAVAAVTAIVLTLGTTNAYIAGAATMAGELIRSPRRASAASPAAPPAPGVTTPGTLHRFLELKTGESGRRPRQNHEVLAGRREERRAGSHQGFLAAIAAAGLLLITLYGAGLVTTTWLIAVPTTLFLSVYLAAMAAAFVVLRGTARAAAIPAALAVAVMLAYSGWLLVIPAVVALAVEWRKGQPAADRGGASIVGACRSSPQPIGSAGTSSSTSSGRGTTSAC